MYLYFNRCRVCGQSHAVGEPHKFGKAADIRRQPARMAAEEVETLSEAMLADELKSGLSEAIEIARNVATTRPRPLTNAEKQKAYRERKRAALSQ